MAASRAKINLQKARELNGAEFITVQPKWRKEMQMANRTFWDTSYDGDLDLDEKIVYPGVVCGIAYLRHREQNGEYTQYLVDGVWRITDTRLFTVSLTVRPSGTFQDGTPVWSMVSFPGRSVQYHCLPLTPKLFFHICRLYGGQNIKMITDKIPDFSVSSESVISRDEALFMLKCLDGELIDRICNPYTVKVTDKESGTVYGCSMNNVIYYLFQDWFDELLRLVPGWRYIMTCRFLRVQGDQANVFCKLPLWHPAMSEFTGMQLAQLHAVISNKPNALFGVEYTDESCEQFVDLAFTPLIRSSSMNYKFLSKSNIPELTEIDVSSVFAYHDIDVRQYHRSHENEHRISYIAVLLYNCVFKIDAFGEDLGKKWERKRKGAWSIDSTSGSDFVFLSQIVNAANTLGGIPVWKVLLGLDWMFKRYIVKYKKPSDDECYYSVQFASAAPMPWVIGENMKLPSNKLIVAQLAALPWTREHEDGSLEIIEHKFCLAATHKLKMYISKNMGRFVRNAARHTQDLHTRFMKYQANNEPPVQFNDTQSSGLQQIMASEVSALNGPGGAGKTTMMKEVQRAFPKTTMFTAHMNATCAMLREVMGRTDIMTMEKFIRKKFVEPLQPEQVKMKKMFDEAEVLVIDESSVIDIRLLSRFMWAVLDKLPNCKKMIFVGDEKQIESVGAGAVFNALLRGLPGESVVQLTQIYRAQTEDLRANCMHIREAVSTPQKDPRYKLRFNEDDCIGRFSMTRPQIEEELHNILVAHSQQTVQIIGFRRRNLSKGEHRFAEVRLGNEVARATFQNTPLNTGGFVCNDVMQATLNLDNDIRKNDTMVLVGALLLRRDELDVSKGTLVENTHIKKNRNQHKHLVLVRAESYYALVDKMVASGELTLRPSCTLPVFSQLAKPSATILPDRKLWSDECPLFIVPYNSSDWRLGYAMTIHAMQGRGQDVIVYVLGESNFHTPRMVYTAFTRARKRFYVLSTKNARYLYDIIQKKCVDRNSDLHMYLQQNMPAPEHKRARVTSEEETNGTKRQRTL